MWFHEKSYYQTVSQGYKVKKVLHQEQSAYQFIEVLETDALGKLLLLDGKTMVSDLDEFVYHEVMAHVSAMASPQTDKVLIIGGGDGGIVREFVKYPDILQIDLVEIDERVIEVSKQFFPEVASGLNDPRVRIMPQDGMAYIQSQKATYDIIIIDSTDPVDFAKALFGQSFYKDCKNALKPHGILMNQTENPFFDEYGIKNIYNNMRSAFGTVASLYAPMIIYPGVYWTFGFCSHNISPLQLNPQKINFMKALEPSLRWYNMNWHRGAFQTSNFHKRKIGQDL